MDNQLFILLEFIIILLTVLITRSLIQRPIKKDTPPPPPPEEPKAPVYIEVPENTTKTGAFEDEQEKARQDVAARLQAWQDLINEDDK